MNNIKVTYSVFPKQEIIAIFNHLYFEFKNSPQNNSILINQEDAKLLQEHFRTMPFVQVDDEGIPAEKYFANNNAFNSFLDSQFEKINADYTPPKREIDYFSKSLFEKVGNNNLDIKENTQTAALIYSL